MKRILVTLASVALLGVTGCATSYPGTTVYGASSLQPVYVGGGSVVPVPVGAVAPAYTVYGSAGVTRGFAALPRTRIEGDLVEQDVTLPDALARDVQGGIPVNR
jgi:hypothetical protein